MGFRPLPLSKCYEQDNKPVPPCFVTPKPPPPVKLRAATGQNGEMYSLAGWEWKKCWMGRGRMEGGVK